MKKVLFASTALVAAGLMTAGGASASEKIKLNLGGYSKWWVVGQFNEDSYTRGAGVDYNSVDIKGDNEVFFGGSTTLDNGMKVGVQVELEAGGGDTTDQIDESYMFVETGFGKFIVGSENNGTYLLHVMAPDAAGNWGEGGVLSGGNAIANPTGSVRNITPGQTGGSNTTAIVTDNDAEKITYVAPTFYGLTVGASYVPSAGTANGEDNRAVTDIQQTTTGEIYGVGALYANTFSGVGLKVSAGYVTYDIEGSATPIAGKTGVTEWSAGTQVSYAGFTLGGSYRKVNGDEETANTSIFDGDAYDVGVQYASGPYAVSLAYFKSKVEDTTANADDDEITIYQASGKYALGAGVDVLASVGHIKYDDESVKGTNSTTHNEGWAVMTGMALSF